MLSVQNRLSVHCADSLYCTDSLFCADNNEDEGNALLFSKWYSYYYLGLIRRVCCVSYNK
jgi:hypothetical protein